MRKSDYILKKDIVKKYNKQRVQSNFDLPICLAPYKSLRFLPDGKITVCCHNNSYILGVYPEVSANQAWKANEIKYLRKKLKKANFSIGCQSCFYAFEKLMFESVDPLLYENYEISSEHPVMLDFKIATECNLECIMCSEYSSSAIRTSLNIEKPKLIYNEAFVDSISFFLKHIKEARFSGGEPFLNDIYFLIWKKLIKENPECKIFIQTNGTILNSKIKDLLERGNFYINVSVDALEPTLYSKIRKNADINQTLKNLEYFSDYSRKNQRKFGVTACAMRDNVGEWSNLMNLANKLNADIWFSEVFFPFKNALWLAKSKDLAELFKIAELNFENNNSNVQQNCYNHIILKNFIIKLKDLWEQAELRESEADNYCTTVELVEKLKIKFSKLIKNQPDKWKIIEEAILSFQDKYILDLSLFIGKYFTINLVFEEFTKMNKDKLIENFAILLQ
ncbi:MAG TPA: radical SAM protein [Bacteroidales bacterium]|nr:radical SAM protein [Bacteroidales bacterium]HQB21416.1 radical SAM protein [Bacteroidales bacterium]